MCKYESALSFQVLTNEFILYFFVCFWANFSYTILKENEPLFQIRIKTDKKIEMQLFASIYFYSLIFYDYKDENQFINKSQIHKFI
jgi:hypothetical protein